MNPEKTYLQHLATIERIAAFVARRNHLNADETEEFVQIVRVRLFENDYAIIRKFKGDSLLSTYLTTVIVRLFQQCRVEQWGKWRPSAEAKRLGGLAITLERLITRDGFSFLEAVNILTVRSGAPSTAAELEALYLRLPQRSPRPVLVSDDGLPDAVSVESDADERLESRDRERTARRMCEVVDAALVGLHPEDRLILKMRFWDNSKVPDIARQLHIDQKKLYKRLEKLFAILRRALEKAGFSRPDMDNMLGGGDQELRLDLQTSEENPDPGPSNEPGEGKVRGRKGKLP
ncbi:MAG TPA: sigma-70 family RNA polymerase sigma factor [Thermoanaerobaculia bacterium]|jgi:RNA polymerase sigma factor (sigma-70 family)